MSILFRHSAYFGKRMEFYEVGVNAQGGSGYLSALGGSSAPDDAKKRRIAENLMFEGSFALSAQVLQEFIANALRKPHLGISEGNIDAMLQMASLVRVQAVNREIVLSAVALRRRYQLSQWDATILAAAKELGCEVVYSKDMNPGQDYGGVRVINPFR